MTMPHSYESEMSILSAILNGGDKAMDEVSSLQSEHFWDRTCSKVFACSQSLHAEGLPVNLITITDRLKTQGQTELLQEARLESIMVKFSYAIAHLGHYSQMIRERYKLRQTLEIFAKYKPMVESSENASDVLPEIESELFKINSDSVGDGNKLSSGVLEVEKQIASRMAGNKSIHGLSSGIRTFDESHGGFQDGLYYVLAGYPSAGKTAFATQALNHILLDLKEPALFLSIEMHEERVLSRQACQRSGVCFARYSRGKSTPEEYGRVLRALQLINKSPFILKTPTDITGFEIRSEIRKAKRQHGIKLCVIDFIQKVTIPKGQEPHRAIGEASQQIQKAAKETGVPCLVLCQLNRASQKEARPRMYHLAESTQIERDADCIDILWPEKDPKTLDVGEMLPVCLTLEKNKEAAQGDEHLWFDGATLTFKEKLH